MLYSPLEQFEIIPILTFRLFSFDLSVTNSTIFLFFCFLILVMVTQILEINKGGFYIPNRWQILFEQLSLFTIIIVNENVGKKGQIIFPFVFSLFLFLLICNLFGIVPYSFTVTSHIVVTFTLSFIVWFGSLLLGFKIHGIRFFSLFVPAGVPFLIIPIIIPIEVISFIIPLISLGVRLFANIISGHILLKVIVGFAWLIIISGGLLFFAHFLPIFILFLLLFLETAVAFIQAYIFTILTCLYIGNSFTGGHLKSKITVNISSSSVG